jgi:broad specificity phosphatase PhoE
MQAIHLRAAVFYSSPLRRAVESAEILANGAPIVVLDELAEISFGAWDGLPWQRIERQWPEIAAAKLADWTGVTPPGGESWQAFAARVAGAFDTVRAGPFPAAVVGHQAVNSLLASRIAGTSIGGFSQDHGDVYEYEI